MPPRSGPEQGDTAPAQCFVTTHWSIVLTAKQGEPNEVGIALEKLCRAYWWPLYAFVRRRGYEAHDAQDLTQEFFARLLAQDFLRAVDRSKGKFRSFLLAAMEHFLAKEWRRTNAQKRGGKFSFVSIDDETAEQPYLQLSSSDPSPEKTFDQQWALTLLNQAVTRLSHEFVADGKSRLFEEIKVFLTGEKKAASYAELAARLGTTEAALKMAVSRMRQRYVELLRAEVANTVNDPKDVEEEWRSLAAALS
jgi:RNA polymerase sigma factor (sigma-70 family)